MGLTFIILGITGDLANKKILPSLGFFSNAHPTIKVRLVGISRSFISLETVEHSLNRIATSNIHDIDLIQENYSDSNYLIKLVQQASADNHAVIVYVAIPPSVYISLLDRLCLFGRKNLHVVLEKPFGQSLEEWKELSKNIERCNLKENIRFFDHYLFKSGITSNRLKAIKMDYDDVKRIHIKAIETVDVKGRSGYYDSTGAIKDMLPSHLFSLTKKIYRKIGKKMDISKFEVLDVRIGQYKDYKIDVSKESTKTETYFYVLMRDKGNHLELALESGKKLERKETSIRVESKINTVFWQIDPSPFIQIGESKLIDLQPKKLNTPEHALLIEHVLAGRRSDFFRPKDIEDGWTLYKKVLGFIEANKVKLFYY